MLKELINLANHLDEKGCKKEADHLDGVITKASSVEGLWNMFQRGRVALDSLTSGEGSGTYEDRDKDSMGPLRPPVQSEEKDMIWNEILTLISKHNMSEDDLLKLVIEKAEGPYASTVSRRIEFL